ncbi:MAG: GDP-L-fucose synthase [Thermoanaerobaculia bacterium]|nr:GDP-L-fucose synthase [Thermoanaerobaculia bacterium]
MSNKRYLVTGGAGFLGSQLVGKLEARGSQVFVPRSREFDLTRREDVGRCLDWATPDIVIHAAAKVGGIGANRLHPGSFFRDNALMGILLIDECRVRGVEKFVCLGTICAYPKLTPVPFREEDLWNGYPEETNAPYGIAKKSLLVMLQAYAQEFGFPGVFLLPVNLYGPRDNFDLVSSHVIPAMIRKFLEARDGEETAVTLWGDGSPTREFLYVSDAADGILAASDRYSGEEPVNLGSGDEISIRDLAELVALETGYSGRIVWDTSQPNGQPRRKLDTQRAWDYFGWKSSTPLTEGIRKTIAWYEGERRRESP